MTAAPPQFPFGSPVLPRPPTADGPRRLFLLGAYPSALHVQWKANGFERVAALAVDNEPEPFWTGHDEQARVEAWKARVGFKPEWGKAWPAADFNGSSGKWVDEKVLKPLGVTRAETWITDCLDTYRFSKGQEEAVRTRFAPFAEKLKLPWTGVPDALTHPDEGQIVKETEATRLSKLKGELETAKPAIVVTLGNAALRVFSKLVDVKGEPFDKLESDPTYGAHVAIEIGGRAAQWFPLVHPGQRSKDWQLAHTRWLERTTPPKR